MYQVQRRTSANYWYDVMLSPFKTLKEVKEYLNKYQQYYPNSEDRCYRVFTIKNKE